MPLFTKHGAMELSMNTMIYLFQQLMERIIYQLVKAFIKLILIKIKMVTLEWPLKTALKLKPILLSKIIY